MKECFRIELGNTGENKDSLINFIKDNDTSRVTLFATSDIEDSKSSNYIPSVNLPVLVALVEQKDKYVLFDGNFLTAVRYPRYSEIKLVLDEAIMSGKVDFCNVRIGFTRAMDSNSARDYLISNYYCNIYLLDKDSRKEYFSLLSNFSESEMQNYRY